eukprot:3978148-Prymnesium_polylepis.1
MAVSRAGSHGHSAAVAGLCHPPSLVPLRTEAAWAGSCRRFRPGRAARSRAAAAGVGRWIPAKAPRQTTRNCSVRRSTNAQGTREAAVT